MVTEAVDEEGGGVGAELVEPTEAAEAGGVQDPKAEQLKMKMMMEKKKKKKKKEKTAMMQRGAVSDEERSRNEWVLNTSGGS